MRSKISRRTGFTLVEIMIVVAIIGLLAAIAIPNFIKARAAAQKNACIANLQKIIGAKEQWALEVKTNQNALPTWSQLVGDSLWLKTQPECPGGGLYTLGTVATKPSCDLSVDPDYHTL